MIVVTEKDKWMKTDFKANVAHVKLGPIAQLFRYLKLELGRRVKVYWVEKLPPKYPK